MLVSDFDYNLPPELIAQKPAGKRGRDRYPCLILNTRTVNAKTKEIMFAMMTGIELMDKP